MLKSGLIAASVAGTILAASALACGQTLTTPAVKTGYALVNGINLYYEIHGSGEPLILLHGGWGQQKCWVRSCLCLRKVGG